MIRDGHVYVKLKNGLMVQVNVWNDEVEHLIDQIDRGDDVLCLKKK